MSAPRGWDERDYKLWSTIQLLPSYGRRGPNDILISRAAVENAIAQAALKRHEEKSETDERTGKSTSER